MLKAKGAPCTCIPRTSMEAMELWGPRSVFILSVSYNILSTEYYNIHVCWYRLMYHQVHVPSYEKINEKKMLKSSNFWFHKPPLFSSEFYALKEFRTLSIEYCVPMHSDLLNTCINYCFDHQYLLNTSFPGFHCWGDLGHKLLLCNIK